MSREYREDLFVRVNVFELYLVFIICKCTVICFLIAFQNRQLGFFRVLVKS